jgi:hypothetical protein
MAVFHTELGKVRYSGNRRFIVISRRSERHATKDGQTAQVLKRSDSRDTAEREARKHSFGPGTTLVVDTWVEANGQKLGR